MANEKKQPTEREIAAQRAKLREAALATFKTGLVNYAVAHYVEESKQYGEAGASAVDEYIYQPTLKSKEGSEIIYSNLLSSRKKGKRYSGSTSEAAIIESAAKIVQDSLINLTVEDVYRLMGSKAKIRKEVGKIYVGDLLNSGDEETKKYAQTVVGSYVSDLSDKKVSEALQLRAKDRLSDLEEMVQPEENVVSKLWNKVTGKK